MNKVDLSDGRIVYEEQTAELQNYMEQAIAGQNPAWNDRILHGFNHTLSQAEVDGKPHYTVKVSYGFGNSPKGFRVVLMDEITYEITEPEGGFPENPTLEFWLLPMKKSEGEWTNKKNEKHPERYLDSGYLVVTVRPKTEVENPSQPAQRAIKVLRGEEYLGEFVDPTGSDLLRLFALDLAQDDSGLWGDSKYVALVEDVGKRFLTMQESLPPGSYHYQDIEDSLRNPLISWVEQNTRWRIADGRELPTSSRLRKQGKTHIPDVADRFLRAWGVASGDRAIGSTQEDAMQKMKGVLADFVAHKEVSGTGVFSISRKKYGRSIPRYAYEEEWFSANFDNSKFVRTDPNKDENRPKNTLCLVFYLT